MARADPTQSAETATRHLFRHFFDERELLRNPYVGAELRAGRLRVADLHERLSQAAVEIEREDRAAGHHERGARQAACLVELTLKARPIAELAQSLGLSARQVFRERQMAWSRAVKYLVGPAPPGAGDISAADVVYNHAAELFARGQGDEGNDILTHALQRSAGNEALMISCLLAELHLNAGDSATAREHFERAVGTRDASLRDDGSVCGVTLASLNDLLGTSADFGRVRLYAGLAERLRLEPSSRWWMLRLAVRLLSANYARAFDRHDRRTGTSCAETAIALGEIIPHLPASEEFALRLMTAHLAWTREGLTPRAEAALVSAYNVASANGWLREVGQVASLLASMRAICGAGGSRDFGETALALAPMYGGDETAQFVYLNLAVAELDRGDHQTASALLTRAAANDPHAIDESGDYGREFDLLSRELAIVHGSNDTAQRATRQADKRALAGDDPLRAAYTSRLLALACERRGESQIAQRFIAGAWELAAPYGHWLSLRTIGRSYRQLTRRPPPAT